MSKDFLPVDQQILYIKEFVEKGGPEKEEWEELNDLIHSIGEHIHNQKYSFDEVSNLRRAFGDAFSKDTIQGHAFLKPHGYAGDFEILDRLHTYHTSDNTSLTKWDEFTQEQTAAVSVRKRKQYFKDLLTEKMKAHGNSSEPFRVLNVASGSCRDIFEFMNENPDCNLQIDCLEQDRNAIKYAETLVKDYGPKVNFINANILRYQTEKRYDLIWSAGLFDYFEDKYFISVLNKLLCWVNTGGELVIGNFSPRNPSRNYMILLNWILYHRNRNDLVQLAKACGVPRKRIKVGQEENGVNLFLHVSC